jgi:hypothetical protein
MQSRVGHCVWTKLVEPTAGFIASEARRERDILDGIFQIDIVQAFRVRLGSARQISGNNLSVTLPAACG